jgi:hypothetical protein
MSASANPSALTTLTEKEVNTLKEELATAQQASEANAKKADDNALQRNVLGGLLAVAVLALLASLFASFGGNGELEKKMLASADRATKAEQALAACKAVPAPAPGAGSSSNAGVNPAPAPAVTQAVEVHVHGGSATPKVSVEKKAIKPQAPSASKDAAGAPTTSATSGHTCTFTDQHTGKVQDLMDTSKNELKVAVTTGTACREARNALKAKYLTAGSKLVSEDK